MEEKVRNSDHLDGKHGIFFMFGIIVALGSVLLAFNWKGNTSLGLNLIEDTDEIVEWIEVIPRTNQDRKEEKLPEPEKVEKIQKTDINNLVITEPKILPLKKKVVDIILPDQFLIKPPVGDPDEPDPDEVYDFVEFPPEFPGGLDSFYKFLYKNIKYPAIDLEIGNEGKAYVQFVVNRDGSLSEIKILRGISSSIDNEIERVLRLSPDWRPGIQNDDRVRVRYTLPVVFQMSNR